jgi:hypothetical protein
VLERQMLGVRTLRHGPCHDRRRVSSLRHFSEMLQLIIIVGSKGLTGAFVIFFLF